MDAQSDLLTSRYAQALYAYTAPPFEQKSLFRLEALSTFLHQHQTQLVGIGKACLTNIIALYDVKWARFELVLVLLEKRGILHLLGGVVLAEHENESVGPSFNFA